MRAHLLRLAVAVMASAWASPCPGRAAPPARSFDAIVLVTVDTLRADRLGVYGHREPTSPVLDALAADTVLFEHAVTACPATAPSVAAILTGHHRAVHGVERNSNHLRRDVVTLAEILRRAHHRTVAIVANDVLNRRGFEQGFERFHMAGVEPTRSPLGRDVSVVKQAGRELRRLGKAPFFLWVHFMAPHGPYQPPPAYAKRFQRWHYRRRGEGPLPLLPGNYGLGGIPRYQQLGWLRDPASFRARYDAEVRYTDALIGLLVRRLQHLGRWERTLFVFTADHGESLGEHEAYFQHGWFAHEPTVHVPLLIRAPGRLAPGRVRGSVSLIDLTPTILALLDVQAQASFEGRSLLPVIEGRDDDRPAFTQTYYANRVDALTLGRWKYVHTASPTALPAKTIQQLRPTPPPREALYDLATDPGETIDLATDHPRVFARLAKRYAAWLRRQTQYRALPRPPPAPRPSPAEERHFQERLRALGYLD